MASRIVDQNGRPFTNGVSRQQLTGPFDDFALPHSLTFGALLNSAYRTYYQGRFDEARNKDRQFAQTMRNDCFLMGCMQERTLAVASLPWHLEVPDDKDSRQKLVRDHLTKAIRHGSRFGEMIYNLEHEGTFYGRTAVQFLYRWAEIDGIRSLQVAKWIPIQGDKIAHTFDHKPVINVYSGDEELILQGIKNPRYVWTDEYKSIVIEGELADRFLIHRHHQWDTDFFDGVLSSEAVHGSGIRSAVFWWQWVRCEWLAKVSDYFDRVGEGVTLWYYELGNAASEAAVRQAMKDQSGKVNIALPRSNLNKGQGLERVETPIANAEAIGKISETIENWIRLYIVGQTLSSDHKGSGGLGGSGAAEFQEDTKKLIAAHDAANLAETLTGSMMEFGLVSYLQRWTFPETTPDKPDGFPVRFVFDVKRNSGKERLEEIQTAAAMVPIRAEDVYAAAELSKPNEDDELASDPNAMGMEGEEGMPGEEGPQQSEEGGVAPKSDWRPQKGPRGGKWETNAKTGTKRHQRPPQRHFLPDPDRYVQKDLYDPRFDTETAVQGELGHWVTINHAHVYIQGGKITKGAPGLEGKDLSDLKQPDHPHHGPHALPFDEWKRQLEGRVAEDLKQPDASAKRKELAGKLFGRTEDDEDEGSSEGEESPAASEAKPAPKRPRDNKAWAEIAKQHSDEEFNKIADNIIANVGEDSFAEQVDWQSKNYQSLRGTGMEKRPAALRARAALETFASDMANDAGKTKRAESGYGGASAGHLVTDIDETDGWNKAWEIGQGSGKPTKAQGERAEYGKGDYGMKVAHRVEVEHALKAKLPVPEDVLAEYPDLAAKHKKVMQGAESKTSAGDEVKKLLDKGNAKGALEAFQNLPYKEARKIFGKLSAKEKEQLSGTGLDPEDSEAFVSALYEAGAGLTDWQGFPHDELTGSGVYIADLYDHLKDRLGDMTIEQFKEHLLKRLQSGDLELSRSDLPYKSKSDEQAKRSHTPHPSGVGEYHMVKVPGKIGLGRKEKPQKHALVEFGRQEQGQWITLGGHSDPATGAKHAGGFRVKVDGGGHIIEGGPRHLRGRKVSDLGKDSREHPGIQGHASEIQLPAYPEGQDVQQGQVGEQGMPQIRQGTQVSESTARRSQAATFAHEARKERLKELERYAKEAESLGIDPEALHSLAAEMIQHDRAHVQGRKSVLKRAQELGKHYGVNLGRGIGEDPASTGSFDVIARTVANDFPEYFQGDDTSMMEQLHAMLSGGGPQPMKEIDAYRAAGDYILSRMEGDRGDLEGPEPEPEKPAATPNPDEEPVPFRMVKEMIAAAVKEAAEKFAMERVPAPPTIPVPPPRPVTIHNNLPQEKLDIEEEFIRDPVTKLITGKRIRHVKRAT